MRAIHRIPITTITVFGTSSLLAITVTIVLYLGFSQAAESTRLFWANQAETLIDAMEQSLDSRLNPVRDQAIWVARDVRDLSNPAALDDYMFGALAATPQVAGVAIIRPDGMSRRWHRAERLAIEEDWSDKPWFGDYLKLARRENGPAWREPIFTDTLSATTLLHDIPLRDAKGEFIGIFAQIVPIHEFSEFLSKNYAAVGITPFVLYDRQLVIAHPEVAEDNQRLTLQSLEELGDPILDRIWTPDEDAPFISRALTNTQASGLFRDDRFFLFLHRDIGRFGPAPWTLGAYIDTELASIGGDRLRDALLAGLAVLLFGVVASILVGRKVSTPIKAIAQAAGAVESNRLDTLAPLGGSRIRELDDASTAFNNMVRGLRERKLIRDTLGRFVPEKVASSLLAGGGRIEVQQSEATVLFCDIEEFTRLTEVLGPVKIVDVLNAYFSAMVDLLEAYGGVVTQFQGDAILATFNVPVADADHAPNAIRAASDMLVCVAGKEFEGEKLRIRIGINTGTVVAGAIGARGRLNYTVHGDAVNLAARLEALNKQHGTRLLISDSSAALAPTIDLISIGETKVRGQTRATGLYTLASRPDED